MGCEIEYALLLAYCRAADKETFLEEHPEVAGHLEECEDCRSKVHEIALVGGSIRQLYSTIPRDECPEPHLLEELVQGEIAPEAREQLREHLAQCSFCWLEHRLLSSHELSQEAKDWAPSEDFVDRLLSSVQGEGAGGGVSILPESQQGDLATRPEGVDESGREVYEARLPSEADERSFVVMARGRRVATISVRKTAREEDWSGHALRITDEQGNTRLARREVRMRAAAEDEEAEQLLATQEITIEVSRSDRRSITLRLHLRGE